MYSMYGMHSMYSTYNLHSMYSTVAPEYAPRVRTLGAHPEYALRVLRVPQVLFLLSVLEYEEHLLFEVRPFTFRLRDRLPFGLA